MIPQSIKDISYNHPVILYDGICVMCCRHVRFLIDRDPEEILRYASLQKNTTTEEKDYVIYLVDKGILYTKSDVLLHLNRIIDLPLYIGLLRFIPPFLRNAGYDFISMIRYQIMGKNETCINVVGEKSYLFI